MKPIRNPTAHSGVSEDVMKFLAGGLYGTPDEQPFPFAFLEIAGTYPEIPGLWQQCKAQILADWTRDRPTQRPHLWWRFDAPNDRRVERYNPDHPNSPIRRAESEAAFLKRHNLLAASEQTYLTQHPELLEDDIYGK